MVEDWHLDYAFLRSSESFTGPILRYMNRNPDSMHSEKELQKLVKAKEKDFRLAVDWLKAAQLVTRDRTTFDVAQVIGGYMYLQLTELGKVAARRLNS